MNEVAADAAVRAEALDPGRSFIVQAPAGSGKTELLTQRLLRLLVEVEHPEEVLAITFTRKAAAEMRQRVIQALRTAEQPAPAEGHKRQTWELARAVLEQDRRRGWELPRSPNRLRLQTIDSLCAAITRQMPTLARLGAPARTLEDARPLYLQAARNTLAALEEPELGPAVARLLGHLENQQERAAGLLVELLGKRDQWLRHIVAGNTREELEGGLRRAVHEHLAELDRTLPHGLKLELCELAPFAARNRQRFDKALAGLEPWLEERPPPGAGLGELSAWQGLAHLAFKKGGGEPYSRVDARHGFPAEKTAESAEEKALFKARKHQFSALLADLASDPAACALFSAVRDLPEPVYDDAQWQLIDALAQVLRRAAAELRVVFQEQATVDFSEVQLRALDALGTPDSPTDLALALDYRLRHILVDEFQDTSSAQYALLALLTAGWQAGDGRSLFAVGDPMQSIYRFREAEVGRYLHARAHGIGALSLEPLTLEVNFRSQKGLVDWVNSAFPRVLPARADVAAGAVPYSPSLARHSSEPGTAVELHAFDERDDKAEAERVVELARQALEDGHETVAVLGRARGHLREIVAALRAAGIGFQALDLEPLGQTAVVQDLRALTRALLHPADRLAWLSVLRAPWCGLALADLLAVADEGTAPGSTPDPIPARLRRLDAIESLSGDGRARLRRVAEVLLDALATRRRRGLRAWIESAWLRLGGAALLRDSAEAEDARAYFDLLDDQDLAGDLPDLAALDEALARLYAPPDHSTDARLQLMTMHKAKGLEFDTVILPGLGRGTRAEASPLLAWLERTNAAGELDLLMAPIKPSRARQETVYSYVRGLNAAKSRLEDGRLLYVAATRARRRLHLLGHATAAKTDGEFKPASNALLARLWPVIGESFQAQLENRRADRAPEHSDLPPELEVVEPFRLRRPTIDWIPTPPEASAIEAVAGVTGSEHEDDAFEVAAAVTGLGRAGAPPYRHPGAPLAGADRKRGSDAVAARAR